MENKKINLNFYGVRVLVSGHSETVGRIGDDFAYFLYNSEKSNDIVLNINFSAPDYGRIPEICASMYKSDCIIYDKDDLRYADYSGKALVIFDKKKNSAEFFSLNSDLLYEIVYLFIHSRAGEMLDRKGLHRVHACSFSFEGTTYVCMLPQGGGKSTLLYNLFKNKKIKLLSDDTPLIDMKGNVLPFPIRIGICSDSDTSDIPEEYISVFKRRQFGGKKLISYSFFKDRIEKERNRIVFICGVRCFSSKPVIYKTGIFQVFCELFKNCIVGYGLPQVIEYFLSGGFKDFNKIPVVFSRFFACLVVLFKYRQAYRFYLSGNTSLNAEFFIERFSKIQ